MTEAMERQQRLAELVATGQITGDSRVRLFPVLTGSGNGACTVLRRDTGRMISTSSEGVDAIRLMLKGSTLQATRQGLADKYGCDADAVDLSALLDCLAQEDFLKSIDGNRISTTRVPPVDHIRNWFVANISSVFLLFVIRHCPFWLKLPVLYRVRRRPREVVAQIEANLQQRAAALGLTPDDVRTVAADNYDNLRRVQTDQYLLLTLEARSLDHWLRRYTAISGLEHLAAASTSGRGTILCAFHSGSYNLIPFILGARGYRTTALANWREQGDETAARRIDDLSRAGYEYPLTVVRGPLAMRTLVKRLTERQVVLILCDTRTIDTPDLPLAPFHGTFLRMPQGVRWLKQRTGANILPTLLEWNASRGHQLSILPAVVDNDPTPALFRVLEQHVGARPAQWLHWKNLQEMIVKRVPSLHGDA